MKKNCLEHIKLSDLKFCVIEVISSTLNSDVKAIRQRNPLEFISSVEELRAIDFLMFAKETNFIQIYEYHKIDPDVSIVYDYQIRKFVVTFKIQVCLFRDNTNYSRNKTTG